MLADVGRYFGLVNAYRVGGSDDFVRYVAESAIAATASARASAEVLGGLPDRWRDRARPRRGSTEGKLM